jgi:hypothetical protein
VTTLASPLAGLTSSASFARIHSMKAPVRTDV